MSDIWKSEKQIMMLSNYQSNQKKTKKGKEEKAKKTDDMVFGTSTGYC